MQQNLEDHLRERHQIALQLAKELEVSHKWERMGGKPCEMFRMEVGSRVAAKGIINAPISLERMLGYLKELGNYGRFIEGLKEIKVVSEVEGMRVIYQRVKGMGPVSDRDFICVDKVEWVSESKVYMVVTSCNYPYKGKSGPVRGEMHMGAYIMEKLSEHQTKFTYITDFDLKGMIPGFVKNKVTEQQGKMAHTIVECMKKQGLAK